MKNLILCLLLFNCGCNMLRYNYEPALKEISQIGKVIKITNDYIEYTQYETNIYRAHYTASGKIFKIEHIK